MDAKDTQEAPSLTGFVEERVAQAHEEQAYDHGYHDGWERRDQLPKADEKASAAFGSGFQAGYSKGFEAGVNFGVALQVQIVTQKPAEPDNKMVVLPPPGSPLV